MRNFTLSALFILASLAVYGQNIDVFAGSNIHTFFNGSAAGNGQLSGPWGVVVAPSGKIYVADRENHAVRVYEPASGNIRTVAGCGIQGFAGDGGAATAAKLNGAFCIAVAADETIYIADQDNNRIRKVDPSGNIWTYAGTGAAGYSGDGGSATAAALNQPSGLIVDASGNIFFADALNRVVRKITPGGIISTVAGTGSAGYSGDGGPATAARFRSPISVGFNASGELYIIDSGAHSIRKVNGAGIITTVAGKDARGSGGDGGPATAALLNCPVSLAFTSDGSVYFADGENDRIRRIDASGVIATVAGTGVRGNSGDGGLATNARLSAPWGVSMDTSGNLFIADGYNNSIRKVAPTGIITTVTGNSGRTGDGGPATAAALNEPADVSYDDINHVLIADRRSHCIRKVDASGTITTIAGNDSAGNSGDGGLAVNAKLNEPASVATDRSGNIYISDQKSHVVRRIDRATGIISRVAGTATAGFSGDGGPATAAQLDSPLGVALDGAGNLYIADQKNNCIRKVDMSTGIISRFAGTGTAGFSGDGGVAAAAMLNKPSFIEFGRTGALFISDMDNNRLRMVDAGTLNITTICGNGIRGNGGDGGDGAGAELDKPMGIAVGDSDDVTVVTGDRLRHVPAGGKPPIRLDAGANGSGFTPAGAPAKSSAFKNTGGLATDASGRLLIADGGSRTIRRSSGAFKTSVETVSGVAPHFTLYPNPNNGTFELRGLPVEGTRTDVRITDATGKTVYHQQAAPGTGNIRVTLGSTVTAGSYLCEINANGERTVLRLTVSQ